MKIDKNRYQIHVAENVSNCIAIIFLSFFVTGNGGGLGVFLLEMFSLIYALQSAVGWKNRSIT